MEYREDLEYYYEDGYGFPINYVQACPPVQDVYEHFRLILLSLIDWNSLLNVSFILNFLGRSSKKFPVDQKECSISLILEPFWKVYLNNIKTFLYYF